MLAPPNPLKLVRSANGWKIDFTRPEYKPLLDNSPSVYSKTSRMFDEVREGVEAGTITSRDESRKEIGRLTQEYGL